MRKILISIGVLISLLWSFNAHSVEDNPNTILPDKEPEMKRESEVTPYAEGQLYWMQMPVVCGSTKTVKAYIEKHKFVMVYVGLGKQGGKVDGQPVYLISEYVTEDMTQSLSVTTTLTMTESCIMFRGFELKFRNNPINKGASVINPELQI